MCGGKLVPTPREQWFDGWATAFPETGGKIPDYSAVAGVLLPFLTAFYRFPHSDGAIQITPTELLAFQSLYDVPEDDLDFYVTVFDAMRGGLAEGREKGREYSSARRPKGRRRR